MDMSTIPDLAVTFSLSIETVDPPVKYAGSQRFCFYLNVPQVLRHPNFLVKSVLGPRLSSL
jgi:hypothetical protein